MIPASIDPPNVAAAVGDLAREFRRARERVPEELHRGSIALATGVARYEIVGNHLAACLLPALSHHDVPPDAPARFTVRLWDRGRAGVAGVAVAPGDDPSAPPLRAASRGGGFVLHRHPHAVFGLDRRRGAGYGAYGPADPMPVTDRGRPLHPFVVLWDRDGGASTLHAGLVERNGRGALFVGTSGTGKTSATLACALDGFRFISDDYVALSGPDGARAHGVYASAHVEPRHLERFPRLTSAAERPAWPHEDKALILLSRILPDRLALRAPVTALFLPTVRGTGPTRVRPATAGAAMRRLVQASLQFMTWGGGADFATLGRLAGSRPVFELEIGDDEVGAVADRVAETLDGLH